MKKKQLYRYIAIMALAAAVTLLAQLVISALNAGVTPQDFEIFAQPDGYATALLAAEAPLRAAISFDYLFTAYYTAALIFLAIALWEYKTALLLSVVVGFIMLTTLLDLHENHELMTFLQMAKSGAPISVEMLHQRMLWSQLKFHTSYVGFFLLAFVLPEKTILEKGLRWSLLLAYLPLGVVVYTYPSELFSWARYLLMLGGLLLLAWNYYQRAARE
jgi:hypothetical protein